MFDIRVVGNEIQLNGLKVADINPMKSISFTEVHHFKQWMNSFQPAHDIHDDPDANFQKGYNSGYDDGHYEGYEEGKDDAANDE